MTRKAVFEFSYESDANASFLVISGDLKIIPHQVAMLENNRIQNVIPVDVAIRDGVTYLYYNITSRIPLSLILGIRKFSRNDLLNLLIKIASIVDESPGYLLSSSNFVFRPEHVYLDPETLEPALVYIPAETDKAAFGTDLPEFISELVIKHIDIDGFENGNAAQKILATVKSGTFNIRGFKALLTELLYGQKGPGDFFSGTDMSGNFPGKDPGEAEAERTRAAVERTRTAAKRDENGGSEKERETFPGNGSGKGILAAAAVVMQIVIAVAIYLGRNFLNNVGDNPATTYMAVGIIVLALEVLLFKKLSNAGLISIFDSREIIGTNKMREGILQQSPGQQLPEKDSKPGMGSETSNKPAKQKTEVKRANPPARGYPLQPAYQEAPVPKEQKEKKNQTYPTGILSGKTELLGTRKKSARMLKRTDNHGNTEDILIDKDEFIIGRLKGYVDYELKNSAVGKLHAQLVYRNGKSYVKDLNSINGTFINNVRLESNKEYELKANDRLQLANCEFIYLC